jgi:hypothetical protein
VTFWEIGILLARRVRSPLGLWLLALALAGCSGVVVVMEFDQPLAWLLLVLASLVTGCLGVVALYGWLRRRSQRDLKGPTWLAPLERHEAVAPLVGAALGASVGFVASRSASIAIAMACGMAATSGLLIGFALLARQFHELNDAAKRRGSIPPPTEP